MCCNSGARSTELAAALADPNLQQHVQSGGFSSLHVAAYTDSLTLLREALEAQGVDVRDSLQRTPLMISMLNGHTLGARLLLAARADVTAQDARGQTPLSLAAQSDHPFGVLLLVNHSGGSSALELADQNGMRPLHWAASSGNSLLLKLLLRLKSSPNTKTRAGLSAIDVASSQGHWQIVTCLENLKPGALRVPELFSDFDRAWPDTRYHKKSAALDVRSLAHIALHEMMYPHYVTRKAIPTFCHLACMLAVCEHLRFSRDERWRLVPVSTTLFEVLVPAILCGVQYIIRIDPGVIQENSGLERLTGMIDSDVPRAALPQPRQLCTSTWVLKGPRAKFCTITQSCIDEFDHYCVLLDAPIGRGNHRFFLLLLHLEVIAQVSHVIICLTTLFTASRTSSWRALLLVLQHPALGFLLLLHCATLPGIMCLVVVQLVLIAQNLRLNELINMRRYQHFWMGPNKGFSNPFSKGSSIKNCLDFWWRPRRWSSFEQIHV